MALDARYVVAQGLQALFVDKDTQLPLVEGEARFYKDSARQVAKSVFKLSGSPPNYTYVDVGNIITMDTTGAFPHVVYLYPYDDDDNVELYFVDIYSATNIFQRSVEAWPNGIIEEVSEESDIVNYIPNGQFWSHNFSEHTVTAAETNIAPGGWYFIRQGGTPGTDVLHFERFGSYAADPSANPRYASRLEVTSAGSGETLKGFVIRFPNVNQFASTTQQFTFGISGKSNTGSNVSIPLKELKNFGSGGSSSTTTDLTTFTFTATETFFHHTFVFGDNAGKTIGSTNDDYVDIFIGSPLNTTTDWQFTDAVLTIGDVNLTFYPPTTTYQSQAIAMAGALSITDDEDAMNLYLPIRRGPNGFEYDDSEIGKPYASFESSIDARELLCDGNAYAVDSSSAIGIPYQRLYNKIGTRFGTGANYYTFYNDIGGGKLLATSNIAGAVTAMANGSVSPTFTYQVVHTGVADYGFWAAPNRFASPSTLLLFAKAFGHNASAVYGAGDSPVTVAVISDKYYDSKTDSTGNSRFIYELGGFGSALSNYEGKYFLIATPTVDYYVWFKLDGSGADPAPGGTGILIELFTGDDETVLLQKVVTALNTFHVVEITCVAASSIPASSYFIFHAANGDKYVVWFSVGGSGSEPSESSVTKFIKIELTGSETAAQVVSALYTTLNAQYFATPDLRGMVLRGDDPNATYDVYRNVYRYVLPQMLDKNSTGAGSVQFPLNLSHAHIYTNQTGATDAGGAANPGTDTNERTSNVGFKDSTMWNMAVKWVMKY